MSTKHKIPPYIQRGVGALIILLMCISVARLLTRIHQLEERIDQLEESQIALHNRISWLQDTQPPSETQPTNTNWHENRRHTNRYETQQKQYHPASERAYNPDTVWTTSQTVERALQRDEKKSAKYTEPKRFDLNTIDSLTLVRIPGIAARTASTILRYRERYGGFYDPWQLRDFMTWEAAEAHMEEWCTDWFMADVSGVRHIRVNQASVAELCRHPYITYEQAIEMVRYRTRHKKIEKLEELYNFSAFKPEDIQRLAFYLSFE